MANNNQLLLDDTYVRNRSIVNGNVDFLRLRPIIFVIQDMKIRPLLGANLFNEIMAQSVPPTTFTTPNQVLMDDYILPCMLWFLASETPLPLSLPFMNKGVMQSSSDNSQPADIESLKLLENRYASYAENYGKQMQNYIRANPSLYPSFFNNRGLDQIQPVKNPFKSPFYIRGNRTHNKDYSNMVNPKDNPIWPD